MDNEDKKCPWCGGEAVECEMLKLKGINDHVGCANTECFAYELPGVHRDDWNRRATEDDLSSMLTQVSCIASEMAEALGLYANVDSWRPRRLLPGSEVEMDGGLVAKKALAKWKEVDNEPNN